MENRRMILIALMGVILYWLYQDWRREYGQPTPVAAATTALTPEGRAVSEDTDRIHVETDKLDVDISLRGGDLHRVELRDYPVAKDKPNVKLALLADNDGRLSVLEAGLAGPDHTYAFNDTLFTAPERSYRMKSDSDTLEVSLEYHDPAGYAIRKLYRFHRDSYVIDLEQSLVNSGSQLLKVAPYVRWRRRPEVPDRATPLARSFMGFGVYEEKPGSTDYKFKKFPYTGLTKDSYSNQQLGGWLVMLQRYFAAAIIPPANEALTFSMNQVAGQPGLFSAQYVGAWSDVGTGSTHTFPAKLYIGPTKAGTLAAIAPKFDLTEDYGYLTAVAEPLFWVMQKYDSWTGNWGVAIILLTLTVRLAFFKLTEAQYRSSARMRKFGPRMKELRERYADNREQLNKAMMDLYKKEGFNPLAGCWPLLIQFPVFMALYWVLAQSVELRQAPFALWLNDLTAPDPYFVLPVLYGLSMWLMQRISGQTATMDPAQARIMNIMPIVLTGMFAFFPSGLVLYWVVSNSLSVAQQWIILRRLQHEDQRKALR